MMDKEDGLKPEWSHRIDLDSVGGNPIRTTISASPGERKNLARRIDVQSLDMLEAELVLTREPGSIVIHVEGVFRAEITQHCSITLEPVKSGIEESFETWYSDREQAVPLVGERRKRQGNMADTEIQIISEAEDPEPAFDGFIDVGELVAQHLSLSINPYPHTEGASFKVTDENKSNRGPVRQNPFAALKELRKQQKEEET